MVRYSDELIEEIFDIKGYQKFDEFKNDKDLITKIREGV